MSRIRTYHRFQAGLIAFALMLVSALPAAAVPGAADDFAVPDPFAKYSDPTTAILAIQTTFSTMGGQVRIIAYDRDEAFLEQPAARFEAMLDDTGFALLPLEGLAGNDHAFIVYLDENGDGRLNRNLFGKPREPFMFSNGVKPKLRKPTFAETKVSVRPGEVVVVTLDN